jgi:hypothetical protein
MPGTRQLLTDAAAAAALIAAVAVVFVAERKPRPAAGAAASEGPPAVAAPTVAAAPAPAVPERPAPPPPQEPARELIPAPAPVAAARPPEPANPTAPAAAQAQPSIYAGRTAANRPQVAQQRGGSPATERAVQNGLDWLVRHQAEDGHWSDRCLGPGARTRCTKPGVCSAPGAHFPTAQTGLALLALQGGGHYYANGAPHSVSVKRGLEWLVSQQAADGCLTANRTNYFMYEHGMAAFALAEAVATARHAGQAPDPRYVAALEKAVRFIEKCQDPKGGGWRYAPQMAGDTSVSGWVVLALKTAKEADVAVTPACLEAAVKYFKSCEGADGVTEYVPGGRPTDPLVKDILGPALDLAKNPPGGLIGGGGEMNEATRQLVQGVNQMLLGSRAAMTGVGLLAQHFLPGTFDDRHVKASAKLLADYAEKAWGKSPGFDYYMLYNCTLGMFLEGGPEWDRWNKAVRDRLLAAQGTKGCERGSWSPGEHYGMIGGRVYCTALAVLTLEAYYRFARTDAATPP